MSLPTWRTIIVANHYFQVLQLVMKWDRVY